GAAGAGSATGSPNRGPLRHDLLPSPNTRMTPKRQLPCYRVLLGGSLCLPSLNDLPARRRTRVSVPRTRAPHTLTLLSRMTTVSIGISGTTSACASLVKILGRRPFAKVTDHRGRSHHCLQARSPRRKRGTIQPTWMVPRGSKRC